MVLLITPVITTKLVDAFGLSATAVGSVIALEVAAFSLATLPAFWWLTRVDLVVAVRVLTAVAIFTNLASALVDSYGLLLVLRAVGAFAAGSLNVIILASTRRSANPGRSYGIFFMSQLLVAAVFLAVYPSIASSVSIQVIYVLLAALLVVCLPFSGFVDRRSAAPQREAVAVVGIRRIRSSFPLPAVLGLAAVGTVYVALSSVWTFLGQVGAEAGIGEAEVGLGLSAAAFSGVAAAAATIVIGDSHHRRVLLMVGYATLAVAIASLVGVTGAAYFVVAAVLFKFAYTFILPFLLSTLSSHDESGHVMSTVNLMVGGGFTLGPILGGLLIDSPLSFAGLIIAALIVALVSMTLAFRAGAVVPRVASEPSMNV